MIPTLGLLPTKVVEFLLSILFVVVWNRDVTFGYHIQQPHRILKQQFSDESATTGLDPTSPLSCTSSRRDMIFGMPIGAAVAGALSIVASRQVEPCHALSPQDASKEYDSYASTYDDLDGGQAASILGIDNARAQLLGQARGDVLEIGVGTGLNLDKYDSQKLTSLTLVDISDGMLKEAEGRLEGLKNLQNIPVKFVKADATSQLVDCFGSKAFDTAVDTFSLCVFGSEGAKKSLDQIKTVVKDEASGGQVLLLENSRSSNPLLGLYQDATADAAASLGGKGCVYNQDVGQLLRQSQIKIRKEEQFAAGVFRSFVCAVSI